MRKILVNIMSRANYGRLTSVIKAIQDNPNLELQLVLGASFYNADIEFPVTKRVQCLINSDDHEAMALTTGVLLTKMSQAYAELKPDVVLIHADRYEMLACAIASSYMNIPLAHTEGGEDSGCIDDKVRNAITQLADIHFTTTKSAYCRVRDLGRSNIYHVGSPALDLLEVMDLTNNRKEDYILVVFHPNTTEKESVEPLINVLKTLNINVIWVNPNVDAGNKAFLKEIHKNNFEFLKDLPPEEYYRLLANCKIMLNVKF
jgi:UDP-hydrolysing UDP-N-acetyl-D-glucosamine 2-epimerase